MALVSALFGQPHSPSQPAESALQPPTFIRVPVEIRTRIYSLLFQGAVLKHVGTGDPYNKGRHMRKNTPEDLAEGDVLAESKYAPSSLPNLLRACRRCHEEASPILYAAAQFVFYNYLRGDAVACFGPVNAAAVRFVALQSCDEDDGAVAAEIERACPRLERLDFCLAGFHTCRGAMKWWVSPEFGGKAKVVHRLLWLHSPGLAGFVEEWCGRSDQGKWYKFMLWLGEGYGDFRLRDCRRSTDCPGLRDAVVDVGEWVLRWEDRGTKYVIKPAPFTRRL